MIAKDFIGFTLGSVIAHRLRTLLTILGIAIGIAAVVLLTSIGEGIHRYVLAEFTQFGTTIVAINPGRVTTAGASIGVFGTDRPLTLEDAEALRRVPHTQSLVPAVQGNAEVEAGKIKRRTMVYGVGSEFPQTLKLEVELGNFLPDDDPRSARSFVVLGSKMHEELFGDTNPLGQIVHISGYRFRIIGTMKSKGQILGFDLDDTVYIPASRALEMFNMEGLMEIDLLYEEGAHEEEVVESIRRILIARHGKEDFTITTQKQMLDVLGSVLDVLTFAVGALGGISLLVGGVGILTIMTMAVRERTSEIGLLRALGAEKNQILGLFLGEATLLALIGGLAGLIIGAGGAQLLHLAVPAMPVHTPLAYLVAAEAIAMSIGLIAGVLPARQAARLDPVTALRSE